MSTMALSTMALFCNVMVYETWSSKILCTEICLFVHKCQVEDSLVEYEIKYFSFLGFYNSTAVLAAGSWSTNKYRYLQCTLSMTSLSHFDVNYGIVL